jgi:hypothetical protein
MAKSRPISTLVSLVVWLTGVLVSLAVGFGMTSGTLSIPWIPLVITIWAGWVVVILTVLSIILAIADRL